MGASTKVIQAAAGGAGGAGILTLNGSEVSTTAYAYNNSNTANTITVSGGDVTARFTLWGAVGGNGSYANSIGTYGGGFAKGTVLLSPGTYYLYVGEGGKGPSSSSFGNGGLGGWPNGGFGTSGDATGAGGGGMTMLSSATFNTSMSDSTIYLIAGASGGTTGYNGYSGGGGGLTGGNSDGGMTGGTQSVGGTHNGSKLQGGNATGTRTSGTDDGGGGGGGYYGGGGGTSDANPGAGGSGFANSSYMTDVTLTTASGANGNVDPDGTLLSGYATGDGDDSGSPTNGQNGLAYIEIL